MQKILIIYLAAFFLWPAGAMAWITQVVITGSTTLEPLAAKISESYSAVDPNTEFEIVANGSGNGIKAIIDGTADIGGSSRFIKIKELEYALAKKTYLVPFQIAYDCIIPIVHPHNTVKSLTLSQIGNIYAGLITNWKELDGSDLPIKVVSRDNSSGTFHVWAKKVMAGKAVMPAAKLEGSNRDVVKAVAGDLGAIGYIGIGFLNGNVKSIRINNIEGSEKTARDNSYPLARPLFFFTRGWPNGEILKFIRFALSPQQGQKLIADSGFIPLN